MTDQNPSNDHLPHDDLTEDRTSQYVQPASAPVVKRSNTLLFVAIALFVIGAIMAFAFSIADNKDNAERAVFNDFVKNEYVTFNMTEVNEFFAERDTEYYYWVMANGKPAILEVNKDMKDKMDQWALSTTPINEPMEGVILEAEKDLQTMAKEFFEVDFPNQPVVKEGDPTLTHYISTYRYASKSVYGLQLFGWLFMVAAVLVLMYWGLKRLGVK